MHIRGAASCVVLEHDADIEDRIVDGEGTDHAKH
jgi:hypothetical protein